MKKNQRNFCAAGCFFLMFVLWTLAIQYVDVQTVGPRASSVGFARFNLFFHDLLGVHMLIYTITDWLGAAACDCELCRFGPYTAN